MEVTEELMTAQEYRLANGGLSGRYNSVVTRLMMTKHGYAERQEVTGLDGAPLLEPEERAKIDELLHGKAS